jgi:polysaccharide biosynthesis protein PslH
VSSHLEEGTELTILWVSHFLPYPSTGHGALQRTHHLVKQLASQFKVRLFALSNGDGSADDIASMGVEASELVAVGQRFDKAVALAKSLVSHRSYWEHLFYNQHLHAALLRAAKDPAAVVLLDTVFLAPYLNGIADRPVLLNHHNVESGLLLQRADSLPAIANWYFTREARKIQHLEAATAHSARVNFVVSPEDAERLARTAPRASTLVVPNGVDVDFFSPPAEAKRTPHSLVFAGGMDWFPNRDAIRWLVTELWPMLVAAEPRRTLTIIGRAAPEEAIALAARDTRVTVTGFVDDVRPYINASSAYLCPIRQGGGTRLKILDALALGCPLVATALSVDGLSLHDGVEYLRADDAAAMCAALRKLDESPALAAEMSHRGRTLVSSTYSWDTVADLMAEGVRVNAR